MKTKTHQSYQNSKGVKLPGVTTILRVLNKPALVPWAWKLGCEGKDYRKVRDKAGEVGTIAHYLIECDLKQTPPKLEEYSPADVEKAENAYLAFLDWRKAHPLETIGSELQLSSDKYGYGGTLDWVAKDDNELWLIDFKSSKRVFDEMHYQVAAYRELYNENHPNKITKVRIIKLGKEDGSFEDHIISGSELDKGMKIFLCCLEIYKLTKK